MSIDTSWVLDIIPLHTKITEVVAEAAQPEAELVGNLLVQLYTEERSTDVVHDHSVNLQTVSQAEAEAVQALLDSETFDNMVTPSVSKLPGSSLPVIETRTENVSKDMVRFH